MKKTVSLDVCYSFAGCYGEPQKLYLGPDCRDQSTIIHELYHVLGFLHEHTRNVKDQHINYQNIIPDYLWESMVNNTVPIPEVPEELIFEGDLIIPTLGRNGLKFGKIWNRGIVPYVFDRYSDRRFQEQVRYGMETINRLTKGCIRFVPKTYQRDFLVITSYASHCVSVPGRYGGPHYIYLGPECRQPATILHELYHSLGFVHEQSRTDRDRYITVLYQNIVYTRRSQFDINRDTTTYGVPYDYESIVHYRQYDFSGNGRPTIITKDRRYQNIIGNAQTLSEKDILKIQRRYKCHGNQIPFQNEINYGT
ncbi:Zinc metalloproteinase nas-1 [Armadillidium nasatum]|uniref:Metalloendopeptidase n=1 Tax=Armadillidium nasatum TaxID=96803 RepID=A0A5N5SNG0_9CRUS|nr:Zinc metalloproteinase nas-1 [Armadillidium nasatum]